MRYLSVILLVLHSVVSFAAVNADDLLQKMKNKIGQGNYELIFVHSNVANNNETLLYRHSLSDNNKPLAQLLYMDGPAREVLLQGDKIAYFQQSLQPFSIQGNRIVDAIPAVFYSDFTTIKPYYDFISKGRDRVSSKDSQVIQISDKEGARYNQLVWIDEETFFPLRVDLIDQQGNLLDQFKVIFVKQNDGMDFILDAVNQMELPPLLSSAFSQQTNPPSWRLKWLPTGFKEVSRFSRTLNNKEYIESALYSDGMFSFSLSVSPSKKTVAQHIKQGSRSILIDSKNNKEVVIIGELPEKTAQKLVNNIEFK